MNKIANFFSNLFGKKHGDNMRSGELLVTGCNSASIPLGHQHPRKVEVCFKPGPQPPPCNPQSDVLSYKILHHKHRNVNHYELIINWSVVDVRIIEWVVYF